MPEKYKPGVGWAVVTPPNFPLNHICAEHLEYSDGPTLTVITYYGAIYRHKKSAVAVARGWKGSKVVKVSVTLWRKEKA